MGLLSKIFKPFKKIIKKVGKAIKGVAKIIAKPLKAVLKPIGKIFGKLGPIGTIALGFILPGLGGALGSWFNAAGGAFQNLFAPNSFMHNAVGAIGEAIKGAAKFGGEMYNQTVGRVFDSISGAIKGGIEGLTGNKLENFGKWTESFMDKITYKGELGIQPPNWQTASVAETTSWTDKIYEAALSAKDSFVNVFSDPNVIGGQQGVVLGQDISTPIQTIAEGGESKGFFKKAVDTVQGGIDTVKGSTVGRAVSLTNEVGSYFQDDPRLRMPGTQGASAFSMLANTGGEFGSSNNFAQFETQPIVNASSFQDTLMNYAQGAFGSISDAYLQTLRPRTDLLGFVNGLGGYGYNTTDALGGTGG
jgi:hypothetical protein